MARISDTLGNGWTYSLPDRTWYLAAPMKVLIEWNGIAPSVYVRTTPADFAAGQRSRFRNTLFVGRRPANSVKGRPPALAHGIRKVKGSRSATAVLARSLC